MSADGKTDRRGFNDTSEDFILKWDKSLLKAYAPLDITYVFMYVNY